jgi:hypothetical protein
MRCTRLPQAWWLGLLLAVASGCGDDDGGLVKLPFNDQGESYTGGIGNPSVDWIDIGEIWGPSGATVSNARDGKYVVTGTYSLGTKTEGRIYIYWSGVIQVASEEDYYITESGTGSFTARIDKISGGGPAPSVSEWPAGQASCSGCGP